MTVNTSASTASYTGNGATTAFTVPFYWLADTDILVTRKTAAGVISTLALNSDYTLAGAGNEAGGSLTTIPALGNLDQIFIQRNVAAVQLTAYPSNGLFPASSHEKALDRLTMLDQQTEEKLSRSLLRTPLSTTYDAGGNTISNVADGVAFNDVASVGQVAVAVAASASGITPGDIATYSVLASTNLGDGASRVAFKQNATGAVGISVFDVLSETISVKRFGAKGDGQTDDYAAIQAAIDYVNATPLGLTLIFPEGTYLVSAKVEVRATANIRMEIYGHGAVIKAYGGYTGTLFYFGQPTNTVSAPPMSVSGLRFYGPYLSPAVSALVQAQNANGIRVANCQFNAGSSGINLDSCYSAKVVDCFFYVQGTDPITVTTGSNNLTIQRCQTSLANSYGTGTASVYVVCAAYNLNILENDFESGSTAIHLDNGGSGIRICGNYIESQTSIPIYFGANTSAVTIEGNWIGYNTGAQQWTNIVSGTCKGNIFWNQPMSVGTSVVDFDIGNNQFPGTSDIIYTPWQTMALSNGFTNTGGAYAGNTAGFRKDSSGVVHLRGMIQATADNVAFTFPPGYRPAGQQNYPCAASTGGASSFGTAHIGPSGSVTVYRGSDTTCDLSSIQFTAAG